MKIIKIKLAIRISKMLHLAVPYFKLKIIYKMREPMEVRVSLKKRMKANGKK